MSLTDRIVLAGVAGGLLLAGAAAWLLVAPPAPAGPAPDPLASGLVVAASPSGATPEASTEIVVDVEGAVVEPGIRSLLTGARIADAIAAAGGYASDADLAASAHALNLAATLADGDQVYVPVLGETGEGGTASGADGTGNGLVNLNTATSDELDALARDRSGDHRQDPRGAGRSPVRHARGARGTQGPHRLAAVGHPRPGDRITLAVEATSPGFRCRTCGRPRSSCREPSPG